MQLKVWCEQNKVNYSDLSRRLGAKSPETARRYVEGARIPSEEQMRAIFRVTGGAVTPNDFYDLPPLPTDDAREEAA